MSFLNELKRRNVFKVSASCVVVAWLLIRATDVVINNIGAPDWVFRGILLVLRLGLPVILLFAWAFESTPEGLKLEKDADRSKFIAPQTGKKLEYLTIAALSLVVVFFVVKECLRA